MKVEIRKPTVFLLARGAVSFGVLAYLIVYLDWATVVSAMTRARFDWIALALVLLPIVHAFLALRWQYLLGELGIRAWFSRCLRSYLIGAFYSFVLPGVVAGDAVRAIGFAKEKGHAVADVLQSVVYDRVVGLYAQVILCAIGAALVVSVSEISSGGADALVVGFYRTAGLLGAAMTLGLVATASSRTGIRSLAAKLPGRRFGPYAESFLALISLRVLGVSLAYSFIAQLIDIGIGWALVASLGFSVTFVHMLVIIPAVSVAAMLPVSVGGWGVREGVLAVMLSEIAGVPGKEAVVCAFLVYLSKLVVAVVGGLVSTTAAEAQVRGNV